MYKLVLVGVVGLAASAWAMQPANEPLKGPPVKDNSVPGVKTNFGNGSAGKNGKARLDEMGPTMLAFGKALDTLRAESAGENKLSGEQDAKLKELREGFESKAKAYMDEHKDEVKSLMEKISPEDRAKFGQALGKEGGRLAISKRGFKGKAGGKGEKNAEPMTDSKPAVSSEESGKARERLKAIFDGRPKPQDTQTQMYAVLSEAQKKLVQDALQKQREEMTKRLTEKKKAAGGDEKKASGLADLKNKSAEEIMNDPRVPERLRERLKSMSPEDREKAIARLRERLLRSETDKK